MTTLVIVAKRWKQLVCASTDEWINEWWCTHTGEYYSSITRNGVLIPANLDEPQNLDVKSKSTEAHMLDHSTYRK